MKPFLFAYSQLCPDVLAHDVLNRTNAVATWVQPFPNAAIVISTLEARELGPVLHEHLGDTWFLLSEIHPAAVQGWLPANIWQFVNHRPETSTPRLIGAPPYVSHPTIGGGIHPGIDQPRVGD